MIHHFLFFIGYRLSLNDGRDGHGCSSILAHFNAESNYEVKQEIDAIIDDAIAYRKQKFDLKNFDILGFSVIYHWVEGQTLDQPRTHHFVVCSQGIYRIPNIPKDQFDQLTLNFSLKVQDDRDLQVKFDDAVEDIMEKQKLSLQCETYNIVNLTVLHHFIE